MKSNYPSKPALLIILFCLMALLPIACGHGSPGKKPVAVKGVIDLRNRDFIKDGPVYLDGQWEFCWGQSMTPSDFGKRGKEKGCGYMTVPGLWKGRKFNGAALSGEGSATYRLKILMGPDTGAKTIIIRRVFSAYKLWINGELSDKKGMAQAPLKTREDFIYIHNKKLSSFTPKEGENEIVLQVFNRDYDSGGVDRPLKLADGETTARLEFQKHMIDMIVVGLLLFSAIYNILFYFFRKTDAAPLYIGCASLAWAVNTYNIQNPILTGALSWPYNPFLFNYITVILGMTLLMIVVKALFPEDFSTAAIRAIQLLCVGFIVPLFILSFRASEKMMSVYFIICFLYIIYTLYVFIKIIKNRRGDALLFFIGFILLFMAGINNALYAMWIIDTGNVIHYAMVAFCFTTTMVVSRRFARALGRVEELSNDLEHKNIALQKMDRLKDQFLANTSHELRTPLHGMIGLSESMIAGSDGSLPPRAVENLSLIASSGHRLANMVNDLLDMAKIQDKGLSLNLRPLDLHALSDMVVKLSLPLAGEKPLEITNSIGPDTPAVLADEVRIRQVLHNLLGNAIKFSSRGSIELTARVIGNDGEDCGMVEIRVSDTGIGIPEEHRKAIFEAYSQIDGGDSRRYAGTGLGLAITKQIVELHNGTIRFIPGAAGGSVFSFTLPCADGPLNDGEDSVAIESMNETLQLGDAPDRSLLTEGIDESAFANNPVILVVDDDPVNVRVIQGCFESRRCVVKTAPDGISALDIIGRDVSIDLVLLDIMMPAMSGYEVCKRIRETLTPEELPVIMLTAKNMMTDIDAAFDAGANDYIVKPARQSELLARVSTMLKIRNIRKSASQGVTIRHKNRAYAISFGDITHVTSHSKNTVIHTGEEDIEVPVLMKEIIHRLPPDIFIRIHKSYIINIRYLHSLCHVVSGRYRVRLKDSDDTELPVGPAFLEALRKKI